MAVIRNIDKEKYALDGAGAPVTDPAKLSKDLPVVQRVYPIDKYPIPSALLTSPRIGRLRILKVPLLGQAGYKGNWCGRTSMSMAYNWFHLLSESDPKGQYITHWNAGTPGWLMNLRFPDGIRAFTSPAETTKSNSYDHGYGCFAQTVNDRFPGKKYIEHALDAYVPADAAQRAARLGKLDEAGVQKLFEIVVRSIELNNPVFMYSGLTKGCNHLILLCGFALISNGSGEDLWIAVADPATEEWIASFPGADGKDVQNALDLTKDGSSLDGLSATHNIISLVKGDWNARRATLSLVRASFFLRGKGVFPGFTKWKGGEDFQKYAAANALVMDDVGNPHPGGAIFYSHDAVHQKTPDDAVVVREPRCVFPVDVAGIPSASIPALFRAEDRPPERGGAYPLGTFDNLHGGIHYPTHGAGGAFVSLCAMAPGTVVAARIHHAIPSILVDKPLPSAEQKKLLEKQALAHELSANSPDFVLVRHEMEIPSDVKDSKEARKDNELVVFYCLYMHLMTPQWAAGADEADGTTPWASVPWLAAPMRERKGTITVVDPDPMGADGKSRFVLDGKEVTPGVGEHFWPADDCTDGQHDGGTFRVFAPETSKIVTLQITKAVDGRVAIVTKKPEGEIARALDDLAQGKLVTFPEPHRNLVVDAGTVVGFADPRSKQGPGFFHWEILSPADGSSGVKKLVQLAAKEKLDFFHTFAEAEGSKNNQLDGSEEDALRALLPAEDKKAPKTFRDLRELSFATSADGSALTKDHYHLRIDVRNFEGILPTGARELRLSFSGAGADGAPTNRTVQIEVGKDETQKIVEVPGWATSVEVESPGIMVRSYDKKVDPADVTAHMKRLAEHRWRNVVMRHLNEWNETDMLEVVKARFTDDPKLEELVQSLCWWGDPETPLYSKKKLFGEVLPKSVALDNLHPIIAVWLINVLLERRATFFRNPKSSARRVDGAKAMFAGWLPAVPKRAPLPAGSDVSMVAISNCPYDADLRIRVVAKGPGRARPVLGLGQYRGDTFVAGGALSGWGKFALEVIHSVDATDKTEAPQALAGAGALELSEPVLAPHNGGPIFGPSGATWDLYFAQNLPRALLGYLVAEARIKAPDGAEAAAWTPCKVAMPIQAMPVSIDEGAPELEGGFVRRGPTGKNAGRVRLAAGIEWRELEAAQSKGHPLVLSQQLLGRLGEIDAKYAAKTGSDLQIVKGSLQPDGCGLAIVAIATRPPRGQQSGGKTAAENNLILRDLAVAAGLQATLSPEGSESPHHVVVSVADPGQKGVGGVMRVAFDPRALYGAVLTELNPGAEDVVEVSLGCDFYNGGHLLQHDHAREDDVESGESGRPDLAQGVDLAPYREGALLVRSGRVDATVALPRIENVGIEVGSYGIQLTADLVGGDDRFWKAAAPVFKVGGKEQGAVGSGGFGRNAHRTLRASFVTAKEKHDIGGTVAIEAMTTKTASFEKVELAAGKVKWEPAGSPNASYDTTPSISAVTVEKHPKRNLLVVTATTHGLPSPLDLELVVVPEGGDAADEKTATALIDRTYQTAGRGYLTTGIDGVAVALVGTSRLKKLGKGTYVFTVRRPAQPKFEKTFAVGLAASASWALE